MAGAVTAGIAVPPATVVMGVSALVFMAIQYRKNKSTLLEVEQQTWISALDAEAKEIQRQFEMALGLKGMTMVDNLVENLNQYREQLEDAVERTRVRIAQPEAQNRQELVGRLKPLSETGETLTSALNALATL
ncbi:hypothetical protein GCM10022226_39230 [Sphaerisporangium flaviroseum]|uniref:Uncharacterized protein n=1 Tax=Sphaerisporangium flaviroseum TaxID=509199 RepID=A0ABP7IC09_9ACTN